MKPYSLCILLLFFSIYDSAFSQCLINNNFATFCGTQGGGCPTFNSPCLFNWQRSHGTPQIFTNPGGGKTLPYNYAYMWAAIEGGVLYGEGIFANYSFFANHSYSVSVTVQATSSGGSFFVYATTGLTEPSSPGCGDPIPVPTSKQFVMQNSPVVNGGWQTFTVSFVPTANYTQLWIYPSTTSTTQYNFYTSYVNACTDCSATITYNSGVVPSGNTKSGDVYAGSSTGTGGVGTVTVSSTATTSLQAVNAIHFEHEFHATVSTDNFSAKIISCSDLTTLAINQNPVSSPGNLVANESFTQPSNVNNNISNNSSLKNTDSLSWLAKINGYLLSPIIENQDISIYPSPSKGTVKITGSYNNLNNSQITVFDQSGKQVYQQLNRSGNNIIEFDLNFLNAGVYFIKVIGQNKMVTKKIIIAK